VAEIELGVHRNVHRISRPHQWVAGRGKTCTPLSGASWANPARLAGHPARPRRALGESGAGGLSGRVTRLPAGPRYSAGHCPKGTGEGYHTRARPELYFFSRAVRFAAIMAWSLCHARKYPAGAPTASYYESLVAAGRPGRRVLAREPRSTKDRSRWFVASCSAGKRNRPWSPPERRVLFLLRSSLP
jgi:hypothetical protein